MNVSRLIGLFFILIAMVLVVPIVIALIYGEMEYISAFILPICGCIAFAVPVLLYVRPRNGIISSHGGFLFVTVCWIAAGLVGATPYYISGVVPSFADAVFESVSGFSTTGASIIENIELLPYSILFWRSFTHWLGGMGIIVLVIALLPQLHRGRGQLLVNAEVTGISMDKNVPTIGHSAKILWMTYMILTGAEIILLRIFGMDLFDAITHSFGTMATGGFSTKNASIAHYASLPIKIIITGFMILAGINFSAYFRLINGRIKDIFKDRELQTYWGILLCAMVLIVISLVFNGQNEVTLATFVNALFHATSIVTTTGYVADNYLLWPIAAQAVLFLLMFCGACSGSTGGGIKIIRIQLMLKQIIVQIKSLIHPQGVFDSTNSAIPDSKQNPISVVAGFLALYIVMLFVTLLFLAFHGYDLLTCLTTALATLGNIGPGFGLIGPVENYAFFPSHVKLFLSAVMICGRLELFTIIMIFLPQYWRSNA